MSLPARFSTLDSGLDAFLFATVGEEENGMPLSVASVLARLGLDPWVEAGRLAALPQATAVESLTALIGRLPPASTGLTDPFAIATRLMQLLRGAASRPSPPPAAKPQAVRWSRRTGIALLLCLGLIALAVVAMVGSGTSLLSPVGSPSLQQTVTP